MRRSKSGGTQLSAPLMQANIDIWFDGVGSRTEGKSSSDKRIINLVDALCSLCKGVAASQPTWMALITSDHNSAFGQCISLGQVLLTECAIFLYRAYVETKH
ncbi:hypothetical protein PGT21_006699 [Puccinia graminis f. sp. tritici]|uniref:Uncharacterized protein n=1 Tax=Puccinia graminis f. sp. tritici TaxID=56615 RepID=A0A5B0M9I7_PUCGR|nr:hypothetical protein PGT21_006699 [Puccinia graminis f. sp. tritici]